MLVTKQLVRISMLSAIGILLFYFVAFPLPLFPEFLTYDAGDIPALIATFAFGPLTGVLVQFLKAFIGLLIGASKAGWVGATANFLAGGIMAFVTGLIYKIRPTRWMAVVSLLTGCVVTAIIMSLVNYYWLLPLWGIPQNQILPLITAAVLPFNFVKFALTSIVVFFIYKRVKNLIY